MSHLLFDYFQIIVFQWVSPLESDQGWRRVKRRLTTPFLFVRFFRSLFFSCSVFSDAIVLPRWVHIAKWRARCDLRAVLIKFRGLPSNDGPPPPPPSSSSSSSSIVWSAPLRFLIGLKTNDFTHRCFTLLFVSLFLVFFVLFVCLFFLGVCVFVFGQHFLAFLFRVSHRLHLIS